MSVWFEDYDNTSGLLAVGSRLAALGFVDTTWRNDTAPSLGWWIDGNPDNEESEVRVWVDYYDPQKREVCQESICDVWVSHGGNSIPFRSWADLHAIERHCRDLQRRAMG